MTSLQTAAHLRRQEKGRAQMGQVLVGRSALSIPRGKVNRPREGARSPQTYWRFLACAGITDACMGWISPHLTPPCAAAAAFVSVSNFYVLR